MTRKLYIEVDEQGRIEIRADWVPQHWEVIGILEACRADARFQYMRHLPIVQTVVDVKQTESTIRVHPRETSS